MARLSNVDLRIYPDDGDSYGHVNQAAFLRLMERARWELLARGPGADLFARAGAWPAIRRASVEYHAPAFPGELLSFDLSLTHLGRTSMSMHQLVRRKADGALVAAGHFLAVCIDASGRPMPVPDEVKVLFGVRPSTPDASVRHLAVRGGIVTFESQGDGDAVLFVHGFPFDRTLWRAQVAGLAGWGRVAPDLRGFGLSDPPPGPWTLGDHADDLAALLDELRIERAVVCALSMGGYVALDLLRRHGNRIRGLVLANTRGEADSPEARGARDATIEAVRQRGSAALVDAMLAKLLAPATGATKPEVVGHVRTMIADTPPEGATAALAAMRDRTDANDWLGQTRVPTLVVVGEQDAIIAPATQIEMARRITGARLEVIPGAGHLTPLEQPEAFNRVLTEFLESVR
jgi:YbgC/YbaW family acyl-CoA thioester hydrolase